MPMYRLCFCVVELDPAEKEHRPVHMHPTNDPPSEDVCSLIDRIHAYKPTEGHAKLHDNKEKSPMDMKALLDEAPDPRWQVQPEFKVADHAGRKAHVYTGNYRLMEHIGNGRWVEREVGVHKGALEKLAAEYNKTGYETPKEVLKDTVMGTLGERVQLRMRGA